MPEDANSADGTERTFVCPDCRRQVTRGPDGTEYGHERGRGETGTTDRCPRRPEGVDPGRPGPDHDGWVLPSGETTSSPDLVTDGGRDGEGPTGTIIRAEHAAGHTWHHSVEYDGVEGVHKTACGMAVHTSSVTSVVMDPVVWNDLESRWCCDECAGSVESLCLEVADVE